MTDLTFEPPGNEVLRMDADSHITFYCGDSEYFRLTPAGAWVRGELVEQDEQEAQRVYQAFKTWLVYAGLTRSY